MTPAGGEGPRAADAMFVQVYEDLRRLARRQRGPGDTLNTTALVHELYLRLADGRELALDDQRSFFLYASQAMRHLLVDRARQRLAHKRGGAVQHIALDADADAAPAPDAREAIELDDALRELEGEDARAAQVVQLHYFVGLPLERIAGLLGVARRTVDRDLVFARAFLQTAS